MLNSQSGFDTIAANDRLVYSFALQRKNADSGTDVKALVLANSCKLSNKFYILFDEFINNFHWDGFDKGQK